MIVSMLQFYPNGRCNVMDIQKMVNAPLFCWFRYELGHMSRVFLLGVRGLCLLFPMFLYLAFSYIHNFYFRVTLEAQTTAFSYEDDGIVRYLVLH